MEIDGKKGNVREMLLLLIPFFVRPSHYSMYVA